VSGWRAGPVGRATVVVAVAVVALVASGCGEEKETKEAKAAPLSITVTEPSHNRFRYRAPRSVRAGLVRMTLHNSGREPHKAQLIRIDGDHSIAQALKVRRPLPRWFNSEGGVGVTAPGAKASITQRLRPGKYYITGSGGEKGRVAPLTVVGKDADGELPAADGSIVTREYSFVSSGLEAGTNSVEFHNEGLEPHHAVVAPVKPGSSVTQLRRFLRGSGPIPVGKIVDLDRALETSVLEEGQRQVLRLRLRRGKYALLCFVADRKGGPAHVVKGMVDEVTVR
jgi:hypothetical protein